MKSLFFAQGILTAFFASSLIGQGLSFGKIYLFHVLVIASVIVFILFKEVRSLDTKKITHLSVQWFFVFYSSVSILLTGHGVGGVIEAAQLFLGVTFLTILYLTNTQIESLNKAVKVVLWVNLAISCAEGLSLFKFPTSQYSSLGIYLSKNQHDWWPEVNSWPTGFHWNPNNNSFFILIFFPILIKISKPVEGWLYFLLGSWVIYMASSKLMLVAWLVMLVLVLIPICKNINSKKLYLSVGFIMISILLLISIPRYDQHRINKYSKTIPSLYVFAMTIPEILIKRFSGENVTFDFWPLDLSLHDRLVYFDGLAKIIKDHPFGIGAGGLATETNTQAKRKLSLGTPHFYLFEFWAKYGIVCLILYISWLTWLFRKSYNESKLEALSLLLFIFFNPVLSSASYFLPKWGLYLYLMKDKRK